MSTATRTRTDRHRPSAIDPAEYEFVGVEYDPAEKDGDVGACMMAAEERRRIWQHMERTGGTYSNHDHGGNCHVCGAHCIYTALFYHPGTNVYIRTGLDCAEKMFDCDPARFRAFRKSIDDARKLKAGKNKAQAILADAGLDRAWQIFEMSADELRELGAIERVKHAQAGDDWQERRQYTDQQTQELTTLLDIVGRLVKYGSISAGQERYLAVLVDRIDNKNARQAEYEAKRQAEYDAAEDCPPAGRVLVTGYPVKIKEQWSAYGSAWKWLIVTDAGWRCWGSVPNAIWSELRAAGVIVNGHPDRDEYANKIDRETAKRYRVSFIARIEPAESDPKFGFYSRPTRATLNEA